jgi:hypothetical protein
MTNNILESLKSENEYSLSELFSSPDRKIIIPDFQRDYCWGDETYGKNHDTEIVSEFLDTLIDEFNNKSGNEVLLGKIDVYENPTNHIYLTDGQQRLTTLFLIVGMLYKQVREENLKQILISDFEEINDDKEPYLQYSIRETTVFFLRDLVNEFFINEANKDLKVKEIEERFWFFEEYRYDPSIISMRNALKKIEEKLNPIQNKKEFANFIINKVKILYYDVKDRKHGEERFVIINTTGKDLTISENVKPILISNLKNSKEYSRQWEERETWFWKNRNRNRNRGREPENIADEGVNDFLTWCFQIIKRQDSIDIIKESKISIKQGNNEEILCCFNKLFNCLQQLIAFLDDDKIQEQFKFINGTEVKGIIGLRGLSKEKQTNILLPLLYFIEKISSNKNDVYLFLRRLRKNYFDSIKNEHEPWEKRFKHYLDWRYILIIIKECGTLDAILTYSGPIENIQTVNNNIGNWYNKEEKLKYKFNDNDHQKLMEMEDYPNFMGDLSPLFNMTAYSTIYSKDEKDYPDFMGDLSPDFNMTADIAVLSSYFEVYKKIRDRDIEIFCNNPEIKNRYLLLNILNEGGWAQGTVAHNWSLRLELIDKHPFYSKWFNIFWKTLKEKPIEIGSYLHVEIREYYNNIKAKEIFDNTYLTRADDFNLEIGQNIIRLWLLLEFLNEKTHVFENFSGVTVSLIYSKNLMKINENKENYQLSDFLLGTSYFNKKSGLDYNFPLMKELWSKQDTITSQEIEEMTAKYRRLIDEEIAID